MSEEPMTAKPDKPAPVGLNLDTLEREGAPEPFAVVLGGQRMLMSDAQDVEWQTLMLAMQDPHAFFRLVVPRDAQQEFFAARLPAWKMRALMDAYTKHYGLTDPGNPAASRT
jgi:hypothetical protein